MASPRGGDFPDDQSPKWTVSDFNLWYEQTEGKKDSLLKAVLSIHAAEKDRINDTILLLTYYKLSKDYINKGLIKESRPFTDKALAQALALKIDSMVFKVRLNRLTEYIRLSKLDSAKFMAQVVAGDTAKLPKHQLSKFHISLGTIYYYQSDFDNAIHSYLQGLKVVSASDFKRKARLLINLGACFDDLGDDIKALDYYEKAEAICLKQNIKDLLASIYNNRNLIFYNQEKYQLSIKEIEKAKRIYEETGNVRGIAISNLNMGRNYALFDEQKALKSFHIALATFEDLENQDNQVLCLQNIGDIYRKQGLYHKAIQVFRKSLDIAKKTDNKYQKMFSLDLLSMTYDSLDYHEQALKFHVRYSEVRDSIFNNEKQTAIAEIETKYQTAQKDNEILQLTNDNQAQEIIIAKNRMTQYGLMGTLALLLLTGAFLWKGRQKRLLLAKYTAVENEKNRIARELHDGLANEVLSISQSLAAREPETSKKLEKTDRELRNFAHQLDSNRKLHGSLPDIMNDFISHGSFTQSLKLKVDFFPRLFDLKNAEIKLNVYRIWQELVSNTVRHGEAGLSQIQLAAVQNKLELTYKDDGKGMAHTADARGLGMQNIFERVNLMKGKYQFPKKPSGGFHIKIEIPLKKSQIVYI